MTLMPCLKKDERIDKSSCCYICHPEEIVNAAESCYLPWKCFGSAVCLLVGFLMLPLHIFNRKPQGQLMNLFSKRYNPSYIAFLVSVALLAVMAGFSFQLFSRQTEATTSVTNTLMVKLKMAHLISDLRDAETSKRGYLLTGDKRFLNAYGEAAHRLQLNMDTLKLVFRAQPNQEAAFGKMAGLIKRRLAVLDGQAQFYEERDRHALNQSIREGQNIMDSLKPHVEAFTALGLKLLDERLDEKNRSRLSAFRVILFFTILSFVVLLLSFSRLRKENKRREAAEFTSAALERKVEDRTREIRQINKQLYEQNIELEKRNEELNSFTFIASHDLKEPLRKILTFSSRIQESEGDRISERGRQYFSMLQNATQRMQKLIEDVLLYAQAGTRQQFEEVDLNIILRQAIEMVDDTIEEKNAKVVVDQLPVVMAIPYQMEQLFTNLLSNALKYSKPGMPPEITVKAALIPCGGRLLLSGGRCWKIDVADNGIGFEERHIEKLFLLFQRLHGTSQYQGTGIGLALCKKIIENHGGEITATSSPGNGATFTIILPERLE